MIHNGTSMADRAVISVHANPELSDRLARLAKITRRSKSSLAKQAIEDYVAAEEEYIAKIEQGQADIAAGRSYSTDEALSLAKTRIFYS